MVSFSSNKNAIKKQIEDANKRMLESVGKAGEGYVKLNTAVDTGAVRDSIKYNVDDKGVSIGSTLTSEDYPIYLEKGTSKMAAQPYISTGIMNNLNALRAIAQRSYKL
ncbi:HK97-gp10 family putative phage morphogenesis protein [Salipaludibacillus sp. CF4.18]|uniref:HK97-gp10 family putative phage morphogenesis protein n=1 Tax=Salipaludibacillus sp. CF4.18 TaxID=3373081 RepID=UPI003EE6C505